MKNSSDSVMEAKNQWERVQEKMGEEKKKNHLSKFLSTVEQGTRAVAANRFRIKRRI